jgi:hypothetical protein
MFGQQTESQVNTEIQLHDCEISEVSHSSGSTTIVFSTAYIHESVGVPGADPGRIWTEVAMITIGDTDPPSISVDLPIWVLGGTLAIGQTCHDGFIPAGGQFEGDTDLAFHLSTVDGSDGGTLSVKGSRVRIEVCGEPSEPEGYTECNRRAV